MRTLTLPAFTLSVSGSGCSPSVMFIISSPPHHITVLRLLVLISDQSIVVLICVAGIISASSFFTHDVNCNNTNAII